MLNFSLKIIRLFATFITKVLFSILKRLRKSKKMHTDNSFEADNVIHILGDNYEMGGIKKYSYMSPSIINNKNASVADYRDLNEVRYFEAVAIVEKFPSHIISMLPDYNKESGSSFFRLPEDIADPQVTGYTGTVRLIRNENDELSSFQCHVKAETMDQAIYFFTFLINTISDQISYKYNRCLHNGREYVISL